MTEQQPVPPADPDAPGPVPRAGPQEITAAGGLSLPVKGRGDDE